MRSRTSASLLAALALSGCVSTAGVSTRPDLPDVPRELRECFAGVVDLPPQAEYDADIVAKALIEVRTSELAKTNCGKRLLAFYDSLRRGLR